ncbi:hypothetical protein STPH1_5118 [Streptomyces sp. OM5714]|nr:hypothetical protein STPH1_5118 [Streptomyces sp. OM5714]
MSLPEDEVVEARLAHDGYDSASLDAALHGSEDGESALADFTGADDDALERVEDLHVLAPVIAAVDERDRRIVRWRFVDELTQKEIGARLGCSQMHVSRLLTRLLARVCATACSPPAERRPRSLSLVDLERDDEGGGSRPTKRSGPCRAPRLRGLEYPRARGPSRSARLEWQGEQAATAYAPGRTAPAPGVKSARCSARAGPGNAA